MKKITLIMLLVLAMLVTACGGGNNAANNATGNSSNTGSEDAGNSTTVEPTEITVMTHFHGATPPQEDNLVEQMIEEATNTKLDIQWNAATNYLDKLNVSMASGELADLVLIPNGVPTTNNVFVQAAENGVFWDVAPYLDDYPNLKNKISDIAWESTKIAGGNYLIPRPRPSESDWFFVLRNDWLDNLGLEMPTTDEELYEVMRAFTHDDPDGNGQDDTTGFVGLMWGESSGDFKAFEGIFTGVNGDWKEENGELVHTAFLPGMRDAIEFMAKAYSEGLILEDFPSMTTSQSNDSFAAGKVGIKVDASGYFQQYYDVISQNVPGFEMTDLQPVLSINGYTPKAVGFNAGNAIPKTVPEEKMKKILGMLDRWMDDDVIQYQRQGIEGTHHTIENGEIMLNTEKIAQDGLVAYDQIVYVADPYANAYLHSYPEEAKEIYTTIQDEKAKISVAPIVGLNSETGKIHMPQIGKDMTDLKLKIILGHEPITAWDEFVEKLKNDPNMQKIIEETNELYKNRK